MVVGAAVVVVVDCVVGVRDTVLVVCMVLDLLPLVAPAPVGRVTPGVLAVLTGLVPLPGFDTGIFPPAPGVGRIDGLPIWLLNAW